MQRTRRPGRGVFPWTVQHAGWSQQHAIWSQRSPARGRRRAAPPRYQRDAAPSCTIVRRPRASCVFVCALFFAVHAGHNFWLHARHNSGSRCRRLRASGLPSRSSPTSLTAPVPSRRSATATSTASMNIHPPNNNDPSTVVSELKNQLGRLYRRYALTRGRLRVTLSAVFSRSRDAREGAPVPTRPPAPLSPCSRPRRAAG